MIRCACKCGFEFRLADDRAGGTEQCPRCGLLVDVPTADELAVMGPDGTLPVELADNGPPPPGQTLGELYRAYASRRTDDDGHDLDLRPDADHLRHVGDHDRPDAQGYRPQPIRPRYDPATGERIIPLGLKDEKPRRVLPVPPADAGEDDDGPIPLAELVADPPAQPAAGASDVQPRLQPATSARRNHAASPGPVEPIPVESAMRSHSPAARSAGPTGSYRRLAATPVEPLPVEPTTRSPSAASATQPAAGRHRPSAVLPIEPLPVEPLPVEPIPVARPASGRRPAARAAGVPMARLRSPAGQPVLTEAGAGQPVPVARPVRSLTYATGDAARPHTIGGMAIDLLARPANTVVLTFVGLIYFVAFLLQGPLDGLAHLLGFPPVLVQVLNLPLMATAAHYGCVVEDVGPDAIDELPRPGRDFGFGDDLFAPATRVVAALAICFGPATAVATVTNWGTAWAVLLTLGLGAVGAAFFPAVVLTLLTGSTVLNLTPVRVVGVIVRCGGGYVASVLLGAASVIGTAVFVLGPDTLPPLARLGPLVAYTRGMSVAVPAVFATMYVSHLFAWHLGMMYRQHHDRFPWVGQRHVPVPRPARSSSL